MEGKAEVDTVYRKIQSNLTNFPFCPKSSFQMKANFASHLETKIPKCEGRAERLWNPTLLEVRCDVSASGDEFRSRRVIWVQSQSSCLPENLKSTSCFPVMKSFIYLYICRFHFPAALGTDPLPKEPLAAWMTVESLFWSGQQTALTQTTQWRIYEVLPRGDTSPPLKQHELSEQHLLWANSC